MTRRKSVIAAVVLIAMAFVGIIAFSTCSATYAEQYNDYCDYYDVNQVYQTSDMYQANMANLEIHYIADLTTRIQGVSVTTRGRSRYFIGAIPIYDVIGGYAYFPSKTDIYKLPITEFTNVFVVGDDSYYLAAYRTIYFDSSDNRKYNIKLVSSIIDGTVVRAGEEFSYNQTTGPRGRKEGYKKAGVIKHGQLVDDYGGGVCQVSSTIHAAVMGNPSFRITKRSPHGLSVSYLPEGMDATVSYNSTDFRFRNNYPFDVVIHIHADDGACIVTITRAE